MLILPEGRTDEPSAKKCSLRNWGALDRKLSLFLGTFPKLRKADISFVMAGRPSVHMERLGFHWTDFHEIGYLSIFRKSVDRIHV
jgi:hypothetical protein